VVVRPGSSEGDRIIINGFRMQTLVNNKYT